MDSPPRPENQPEQEATEASIPECPICYLSYDNVFRTPLRLPCSHTFCLECLARLCAFLKQNQDFRCPLCRESVSLPAGGVPKLPANMDVVQKFPPWMQNLQEVWLDGLSLCWLKKVPGSLRDEAGEMLVTLSLYAAVSRDPHPGDLVSIHRPTCWELRTLLRDHHPSIFCAAAMLLFIVVLPLVLILGLQQLG